VDYRLLATVRNHTGRIVDAVGPNNQAADYVTNNINGTNYIFVRGWPALNSATPPEDADNDGIADYWELAMNWSTNSANNNHTNSDGYTDLEWYLNWLAAPHAVSDKNGYRDVNLGSTIGITNGFTFTVVDGTNGTATLLGDGYTARFTPSTNYSGLANFFFHASNTVDHAGFGPVEFSILVSNTSAASPANTVPILDAIPDYTVIAGTNLTFTNTASDTDVPAQTLTFALFNGPGGATLDTNNGVFNWRPSISQGDTSNNMSVVVTDNGTPNLSATQAFTVTVLLPVQPGMQSFFSNSDFNLLVTGDIGPDYTVEASSNLMDWDAIFTTNSPPSPFLWFDPNAINFDQRFYRVLLGP
jgi:hypothetical protein